LPDGILLVAGILVLATWISAALTNDDIRAGQIDNVHWTIANCTAAWLAWHASNEAGASALQRTARRRFAWALLVQATSQLLFDVAGYFEWWPVFPGPDDALLLLVGPIFVYGFAGILHATAPASRFRIVQIDIAGFALAVLALTLTLYLPKGNANGLLAMAVFAAYPVSMLTASAAALVMQLHLRQRWNGRWIALFFGLCGYGAAGMIWYLNALGQTLRSGSMLTLGFSAFGLLMGWGAAGWRPQPDLSANFDRLCEGVLRQLPLAMVALASCAFGLLMLDASLANPIRVSLLTLDLSVLLFAVFRQTQQLVERDRLLVAERVVAESQAKLKHLAHHDPLTGLPNLTLLRDRIEQAIMGAERRGTKVAVLFLDLDHFKEVNDTLSHATGDALLKYVATSLQEVVRASDTVSRQGGDEFTIVLPDIDDIDIVVRVAEAVMQISSTSARLNAYDLPLSLSVGVALYPDDAKDFASLLQCADAAMYRAKAGGRNTYRFYDSLMNAEAAERIRLRVHLAHAIERGELLLHYQPLIDLQSGGVCGAEALLRWHSPELGDVAPGRFIPIAEDFGLIVDIGGWVLQEACRQAAAWRAARMPSIRVAVNVSVLQFRRGNLEAQVVDALRKSGLPPQALELEVTESVLMRDNDRVMNTLERLAELGVSIAIDDFGTGYSSLSYLRRMHVSKLKIDRIFVHEALEDEGTAAIVHAVVDMARALKVATVAEGVETEAQYKFLRSARCNVGQGYYFARPLAPQAFEQFLAKQP
jgi:diguanylate cyclase (GGDEF)-like protein